MKLISIDFETYLISEEMPIPKPVCLSYYDGEHKGLITGQSNMHKFLKACLTNPKVKLIAHNAAFEGNVIAKWFPDLKAIYQQRLKTNHIICTKVYEQLIDNNRKKAIHRYDLATLVNHYFEVDISEDKKNPDAWRLRYHELDGIPKEKWPQEAIDYAIDDSIWAYKCYLEQKKFYIDIQLTVESDYYLNLMGTFGIRIDPATVNLTERELIGMLTPKYESLKKKGLVKVLKSGKYSKNVKALREYIEKTFENPVKTVKGSIATSKEHLEKYSEDPIIADYLAIMASEKILTAFISRLKGADTIRTQYNACVSTGRTSSRTSQAFPSVNIQQMPREVIGTTYDIRNCFIARPGYHIVSIDYSGLEMTVCANQLKAFLARDEMCNVINRGNTPTDMHSMLAYRIKNLKEVGHLDSNGVKIKPVTYEEFVSKKKEPGFKEYRQLAKPINLGFPGGIGYDTMRSLLFKEGIIPKLVILNESRWEDKINKQVTHFRKEGHPVRCRRVAFDKYQLIWDELVLLKWEMFKLYPDLEEFLKEGHKRLLTGETKPQKNEWGEWETEPMYRYRVGDFSRDWCMYTQVANGFLMQAPAAQGFKRWVNRSVEKYYDSEECNVLAGIHDEIVVEIKKGKEESIIKDLCDIGISEMQKVLPHVRISVEADITGRMWSKSGDIWSKTYWKNPGEDKLYEA